MANRVDDLMRFPSNRDGGEVLDTITGITRQQDLGAPVTGRAQLRRIVCRAGDTPMKVIHQHDQVIAVTELTTSAALALHYGTLDPAVPTPRRAT
ncbi:MAG: hypothetical protein ACK5MT_09485 [Actinomycetales bacterium]